MSISFSNRRLIWAVAIAVPTVAIGLTAYQMTSGFTKWGNKASNVAYADSEGEYEISSEESVTSNDSHDSYFSSYEDNSSDAKVQLESNGITLSVISEQNTGDATIKVISYSVDPEGYKDSIYTEIVCPTDASYPCQDYVDLVHDKEACTITLTVKKAFTKQMIIRILSHANENVNGTITMDYQDKITGTEASLSINDGEYIVPTINVLTTGGTLPVDTSISQFGLTYDDTDISSKLKDMMGLTGKAYTTISIHHSLASQDFLSEDCFNLNEFIKSYSFDVIQGSNASATSYSYTIANQFTYTQINSIFDGKNNVFCLTFTVNGKVYQKEFPFAANLTSAPILHLYVDTSKVIF